MALKTQKWDAVEFLDTEEKVFAYIEAAFEDGDPALITAALGDIARARGMARISKEAGVSRENLYRALCAEGNPEFGTVLKVVKALGLHMGVSKEPEPLMTPDRLDECLQALRWSPDTLASAFECDVSLVEAWLTGESDIPPKAAAWVETLASYHEAAEEMKPTSMKGKKWSQ